MDHPLEKDLSAEPMPPQPQPKEAQGAGVVGLLLVLGLAVMLAMVGRLA